MKNLSKYIEEKLVVNKNYKQTHSYAPTTWDELRELIKARFKEQDVGTKKTPINFNDIDVTGIDTFTNDNHIGVFSNTQFEYIDVSEWNVSNITDMTNLFSGCEYLKSVGNLSKWNVSYVKKFTNMFNECYELTSVGNLSKWKTLKAEEMQYMFCNCYKLKSIGDLSKWYISGVKDIHGMFSECKKLESIGDLSKWDVSNVKYTKWMFYNCQKLKSVGDLSNWNNIKDTYKMFFKSGITNIPDWYKG